MSPAPAPGAGSSSPFRIADPLAATEETSPMNTRPRFLRLPSEWRWRHVLVCLLAALIAVPMIERARSVAADVPPIDPSMICSLNAGCLPPAPLLNVEALQHGLYA